MNIFEAIILGLVQGLTEFIPVSSSGHLLLMHHAFGISEQGLGFDVALHIGTLLALTFYFHRDIAELLVAFFRRGPKTRLAWLLVFATIPAVVAGMLLQEAATTTFRSPVLVSVALAVVALIMLVAERYAVRHKPTPSVDHVSFKQGLLVGLAQAVALIPGVSRSGSTIVAGLFAGLDRVTATRFSFLLSMPITFGAIVKVMSDSETARQTSSDPIIFFIGVLTALVSGLFAIRFLLKFVARHSLNVFAYYRLALAAVTLLLLTIF